MKEQIPFVLHVIIQFHLPEEEETMGERIVQLQTRTGILQYSFFLPVLISVGADRCLEWLVKIDLIS